MFEKSVRLVMKKAQIYSPPGQAVMELTKEQFFPCVIQVLKPLSSIRNNKHATAVSWSYFFRIRERSRFQTGHSRGVLHLPQEQLTFSVPSFDKGCAKSSLTSSRHTLAKAYDLPCVV